MRQHFAADWAFGIKGAMENVVRSNFPSELRNWPILQSFNFEAYRIDNYAIFIFKDKLSGVVAGPGDLLEFPHKGYPEMPPKIEELELWHHYFKTKFKLRKEDFAFLIPIHDSGKNSAPEDFKSFTKEEKDFWNYQLSYNISNYKGHLDSMKEKVPQQPQNIIYNVSGNNTRVNINSKDSSVNIVDIANLKIFNDLKTVANEIENEEERIKIVECIESMETEYGKETFIDKYKNFISVAADHLTIFAPFIPALTEMIKNWV